jgi:hypothetical protein
MLVPVLVPGLLLRLLHLHPFPSPLLMRWLWL